LAILGATIVRAGPFLTLTVILGAVVRMRAVTMLGLLSDDPAARYDSGKIRRFSDAMK